MCAASSLTDSPTRRLTDSSRAFSTVPVDPFIPPHVRAPQTCLRRATPMKFGQFFTVLLAVLVALFGMVSADTKTVVYEAHIDANPPLTAAQIEIINAGINREPTLSSTSATQEGTPA